MKEFNSNNYVIEVLSSMRDIPALEWDALLAQQTEPTPFMRHAYLLAMEESGSASPSTGWKLQVLTLRYAENCAPLGSNEGGLAGGLAGAMALYIKPHSYGEYVFDWGLGRRLPKARTELLP